MRLSAILAAAATALIATAGIAAGPAEHSFSRDGRSYVYTTSLQADGNTLIEGHEKGSGRRFQLVVKNRHVTGQANGVAVSFRAPRQWSTGTTLAAN